ncbi:NAD(P)H-dependent oxidoreductase [Leadbetterella byssophila]|uniref:NAD(P)H-dependent oxidoreductase n=1 Tax=Leadbetterella byssophila TaxID=316068 RepID=UPI0039A31294
MKMLVINGHPYKGSYVSALFQNYLQNIEINSHEVRTLVLGDEKFDPILRFGYSLKMEADDFIERSQKDILWADHLVFFYSVWCGTMPALLQGWIDRVLMPGFAYNMKGLKTQKHLKGKTAELFITADAPEWYIRYIPNSPIRLMRTHILGLCGIRVRRSHVLGMTTLKGNSKARIHFLTLVGKSAARL